MGRASHIAAGEVQLRGLKGSRTLWSTFIRDPERTFKPVWNSNWPDFLFCLGEDFCSFSIEQLFLITRWFFWCGEKDSEVVIKGFLKIRVHLLFGHFGVCIYCIYSVISVTFYLKLYSLPSKKSCVIFFIESPLKLMGNVFYFILKALFILKIFQFFVMTFWSCRENGLIRKIRLTSKFMASQPAL